MPTPIYYPPEDNGLQKTLNSALLTGVTASLTLNNANKIQNKPGVLVVDRIDTNGALKAAADREYIVYTGVSGSTLTGLTRGVGGSTDQDHSIGAIVEFVPDVVVHQMIADGLAVLLDASDVSAVNTTNVVTPTGTQDLSNKTLVSPLFEGTIDGWISAGETWTYVSVDDPTGVIRVNADVTGKYSLGMRIRLVNGGNTIYGIITAVSAYGAIDAGYTHITFLHEIDPSDNLALYLMANSAITANYYSTQKAPFGFPIDPRKWSVEDIDTSSRTQASPTQNAWYNLGSNSLAIPIGAWNVEYYVSPYVQRTATATSITAQTTLSTANNSSSDGDWNVYSGIDFASGQITLPVFSHTKRKFLSLTAKTTYYLNTRTSTASANVLGNANDLNKLFIRATCAYL